MGSVPTPPFSTSKTTLCFLVQNDEILLSMKKRGFGKGKWNGVGGKLEANETYEEAIRRETQEEIGVTIDDPKHVATLYFHFSEEVEKLGNVEETIVYLCMSWEGEPVETDEMAPRWFKQDTIPYPQMWEDDRFWLPHVLSGKFVTGQFMFDTTFALIDHSITIHER